MQIETIVVNMLGGDVVDENGSWKILVERVSIVFIKKEFAGLTVDGIMLQSPSVRATRQYTNVRKVPEWAVPLTVYGSWEIYEENG